MTLKLPTERSGLLSPDWLAESVRITFFLTELRSPSPLWERVVGARPSEINERPNENIRVEAGDFSGGVFIVTQQSDRTDLIYNVKGQIPFATLESSKPSLLHLGPSHTAISITLDLLNKTPTILDGASRLAFAPTFIRLGNTNEQVNGYISATANLLINPSDSDVLWQINKPVNSKTFEGTINRVAKWQSVANQQPSMFFINSSSIQAKSLFTTYFARVELDINTIQIGQSNSALPDPIGTMSEIIESALPIVSGKDAL